MRMRPRDLHMGPNEDVLQWTALPFAAGWANYDTTNWRTAGYAIDELGWVMIRGMIVNSNAITGSSLIATMPQGHRPSVDDIWQCYGYTGNGVWMTRVDIFPDGQIVMYPQNNGYPAYWMSLTSGQIRYKPEVGAEYASASGGVGS